MTLTQLPEAGLDDRAWLERCRYWSTPRPERRRPGAPPRRVHRPLILTGHGMRLNVDQGTLLVRHHPQKQELYRFFPGDRNMASYVPGELIPLPLSGSIPKFPHVAKVENRTTLKISRKSIFGLLCCCFAPQCPYVDPQSILDQTIRSLNSPRVKRTSGSGNFPSTPPKDFCNFSDMTTDPRDFRFRGPSGSRTLGPPGPLLMLWTAPPPAHRCHGCGRC